MKLTFWETNPLPLVSVMVGLVIMASRLPGVVAPGKYRAFVLKFPRSVTSGRVLLTVVTLWAGFNLYGAAVDEWAWARPLVVIGVPVAYWMVIQFGNQFLSLRAAAALMLLVANVMVKAADRHESPWRLVVTVLAYLWVVAAIWIAAAPNQCRDVIQYLMANDRRCRMKCAMGVVIGAVLVLLGMFVY